MTNQAGGDAGNNWHRQLFVGQIPGDWTRGKLEQHLAKFLKIPEDHIPSEIQFDPPTTLDKPSNQHKKIAFIRFKSESYHNSALKKETFYESDVKLNIKESNHENEKRKLFFGRLCDNITEDKVSEMIETVSPGYAEHIEEDFPQVPEQTQIGKSRIAFVLFKTHQAARDVKEAFKKLIEHNSGCGKDKIIELLKKLSHNGSDIRDLVTAVDYHKRTGKLDEGRDAIGGPQCVGKTNQDSEQHQLEYKTTVYNDGKWEIHLESRINGKRVVARLLINPIDLQRGVREQFGKGSSIELIPLVNGQSSMTTPSNNGHPFARNHYRSNYLNGMYNSPNYGIGNANVSRNVRRNLSCTNTAQRPTNQTNLAATRSESGLHR